MQRAAKGIICYHNPGNMCTLEVVMRITNKKNPSNTRIVHAPGEARHVRQVMVGVTIQL
jgi:hypothetical protein